ncbi:hypothetical protein V492_08504 [Pseudogymnoascus sp. VKM F-4246]|nr:hypothetical protein V492_08504 [Pseudogymnoascus sp. VKM F-4246]
MFLPLAAAFVAALATSALAAPENHHDPCHDGLFPTQIRLAYAGDKGMAVSWNTKERLTKPTVYFGKLGDKNLNRFATSKISTTYPTSSTYSNHVVISGLQEDTTYYYMPQCATQTYVFTTARSAGNKAEFSFAMIGDMGTFGPDGLSTTVGKGASNPLKPGEHTTIQSLMSLKNSYDFVWHVGDIAYADAWLKEEKAGYIPLNKTDGGAEYDKILNQFYNQTEEISSIKPYMVGPGNHEANCDNGSDLSICLPGQLNFTSYRAHWNMPSAESGGVGNFWYSFDHGSVHFIQFNTETDFPNAPDEPGGEGDESAGPFAPSGAQLAWLKKDLASVDRRKTPWVVAAGHRPWYVSTTECIECQDAFEPLLLKYGVDLVLHGHKHFYERHAAVGNGTATEIGNNPKAPWYVVNGAAGHYDGLDIPDTPPMPCEALRGLSLPRLNVFILVTNSSSGEPSPLLQEAVASGTTGELAGAMAGHFTRSAPACSNRHILWHEFCPSAPLECPEWVVSSIAVTNPHLVSYFGRRALGFIFWAVAWAKRVREGRARGDVARAAEITRRFSTSPTITSPRKPEDQFPDNCMRYVVWKRNPFPYLAEAPEPHRSKLSPRVHDICQSNRTFEDFYAVLNIPEEP